MSLHPNPGLSRLSAGLVVALMLLPTTAVSANSNNNIDTRTVVDVEFLGEVVIPTGTVFDDTEVGGLSSITYDGRRRIYHVLSDDQGNRTDGQGGPLVDPPRFYTVDIDLSDGTLDDGDIEFVAVTELLDRRRRPFAPGGLDPEGLVWTGNGFFVSSEGNVLADPIIDPFIRRYNRRGLPTASLRIPDKYQPNGIDHGVRFNLAFESLNLTPDGRRLITAGEGALFQDGPASTFDNGSLARILQYTMHRSRPEAEFVYPVGPWAEPSAIFGVNGIVEVLPIDNAGTMLVMERSFSVGGTMGGGTGNVVEIHEISTRGATDVLDLDALYRDGAPVGVTPVSKQLRFRFDDLGIPIDNIEGMTFGPRMRDGQQTLVVVSDNNFSAGQFTQFIVLALDIRAVD